MTEAIVHFQNFKVIFFKLLLPRDNLTHFKALHIPQNSDLTNRCVALRISVLTHVFDV